MFNSKFFTVMIVLTFLAVGATVAFQAIEMNEYELFETLFGLGFQQFIKLLGPFTAKPNLFGLFLGPCAQNPPQALENKRDNNQ